MLEELKTDRVAQALLVGIILVAFCGCVGIGSFCLPGSSAALIWAG